MSRCDWDFFKPCPSRPNFFFQKEAFVPFALADLAIANGTNAHFCQKRGVWCGGTCGGTKGGCQLLAVGEGGLLWETGRVLATTSCGRRRGVPATPAFLGRSRQGLSEQRSQPCVRAQASGLGQP